MGYGWMGGQRESVRGEYMFSSHMKQKNKRRKFASSFTSPEKEKYIFFIYVITWENFINARAYTT